MAEFTPSCPIPITDYPNILMAHGGGGRLTGQLIEKLFLPAFANPFLAQQHDGALLDINGQRLAFSTDSYVVQPLFFPGGDIGALAVNGTVNDLAMCGARPLYLSAGFIIEEGLPAETLWRIVQSMSRAAVAAGVQLVTGDTKVVDKGKGDGVFINTAGIGIVEHGLNISPASVLPGDALLLSGDLGRHGMAIMSVREGLRIRDTIESDCAPLAAPVQALLDAGIELHCLRDLTRGGLSSALNEIAEASRTASKSTKTSFPWARKFAALVKSSDSILSTSRTRAASSAFVAPGDAEQALAILRSTPPAAMRLPSVSSKQATAAATASSRSGAGSASPVSSTCLPASSSLGFVSRG